MGSSTAVCPVVRCYWARGSWILFSAALLAANCVCDCILRLAVIRWAEEVAQLLRGLGDELTEAHLNAAMAMMDKDGSGGGIFLYSATVLVLWQLQVLTIC